MKTLNQIVLAAFIPLTIVPMIGTAAEPGSANWNSSAGLNVISSNGECVRSSSWTPALAIERCDPSLIKKAEIPPVAAAEVAPAPAPAPGPVVIAPPPAPEPIRTAVRKVSLSTEDLFAFDKSTLKPEGKDKLDKLVEDMRITNNETIVATGHADRIGNKEYNQKLSERRAETVRDYLISKGVSPSQVRAEGMGESQPATAAGECRGQVNKQLIACLQPDRRVEVEVNATRTDTISSTN